MKKAFSLCNKLMSIIGTNTNIPQKTKNNDFYTGVVKIENGEKVIRCSNGNSFSINEFQDTSKYHENNPVIIGKLYWSKNKPVLTKAIDILNIEDSEINHKKTPLSAPFPLILTSGFTIVYLLTMHMFFLVLFGFINPYAVPIYFLLLNTLTLCAYCYHFYKKYDNWNELYIKSILHFIKIILILFIFQVLCVALSFSLTSLTINIIAICTILIYYFAHNVKVVRPSLKYIEFHKTKFNKILLKKANSSRNNTLSDKDKDLIDSKGINRSKAKKIYGISISDISFAFTGESGHPFAGTLRSRLKSELENNNNTVLKPLGQDINGGITAPIYYDLKGAKEFFKNNYFDNSKHIDKRDETIYCWEDFEKKLDKLADNHYIK